MSEITCLADQLKRDEGVKSSAYQDQLGFWTVGIGTCIDARKGCGLTEEEIVLLFHNRLSKNEEALSVQFPWTDALDPVRRGALLNMVYEMGLHGLGEFREFLGRLQAGDYNGAAAAMLDSTWARSRQTGGGRRERHGPRDTLPIEITFGLGLRWNHLCLCARSAHRKLSSFASGPAFTC